MPFSEQTKGAAWARSGGRCECTRMCFSHMFNRCNQVLVPGNWHAHHRLSQLAGGADTLDNCEALCVNCHQNTHSYGRS